VLKAFLESRRRRQRSKRTIQSYKSVIRLFFRRSGLAAVAEVRPGDVETFIWNLSVAPGTRAARDRHLRAFFRWAVDEGILTSDPSSGLDRPVQPEKVPRNVTANELQRICTSIKADYRLKRSRGRCRDGELLWLIPVFQFAFLTGLRAAEIARLRWGDVDRPNGRLFLWRQKNGRESVLPISRKADDILHDLEAGPPDAYVFRSPRTPSVRRSESSFAIQVSRAFTRYRNAARIKRPVTFHGLRHGFCTTLAEAGKSAVVIQAAARHRSLSTSMRYVHLAGDFLRAELDDAFA
jgi:integrase